MAKLDVVKAAVAGFGVIRRAPGAVAGWALFILLAGVVPAMLLLWGGLSSILQLAEAEARGVEPAPEQIMPLIGAMFLAWPILMIVSLLVRAMLTGAVFRAVLEPEKRSWAYLRLGMRELWLILVGIVLGFILGGVYMLGFMPMAALPVVFQEDQAAGPGVALLAFLPLWFLAVLGVLAFLAVRLSMALPMSFAENRFRLFESWKLTHGNGWRLVLVVLLLFAILMAVEMGLWVFAVLIMLAFFGVNFAGLDEAAVQAKMEAFFAQDPSAVMLGLAPWFVIGAVLIALIASALMAVFTAPWAEAYRQLVTPEPATAP